MASAHEQFRDLAWKCDLTATHQRQVIYEAVIATPGHHSVETVFAEVRRRTPSISLATVYNNLRLFVEHGLLREVSPHSSMLLVEGNLEPHHHLICTRCKAVQDLDADDFVNFKKLARQAPRGFDLSQPLVEVFGLCQRCSAKT
jgi:Fur family transcriptional regulator, peroxide stress response regulator